MAESYLSSQSVQVFPTTRRTYKQPDFSTRLMTESSIARIVNKLIDFEGFVISDTITNTLFELNLWGYYFKLRNLLTLLNNIANVEIGNDIYAIIFIDNSTVPGFSELVISEEASQFKGIIFSNSSDYIPDGYSSYEKHFLAIARKTSSGWIIPPESKIKFNFQSVGLLEIDGGVIT